MADPREEGLIYLDGLIEQLRSRAEGINTFWLKAIGKRIRELKHLDPSDAAGIAAIRNDTHLVADIVEMVQKAGQDTVEDARNVLRAAARLSMEASPVAQDLTMDEWINGIAQASAGRLSNLSNTTAVGVRLNLAGDTGSLLTPGEAYKTLIDAAAAQMASGTMGLNQAVRNVLKQFADSGLQVVDYESGRTRSLGAAVEMNLKEATSMVYQGVQERIGQEFGADGVEISAHWDCAPDHLDVQGKQYSKAAFEKLQGSLARPIGKLNCRHIIYSIILGVSEPTYSDAELREMKEKSLAVQEFDGKYMTTYEATQVQRKLEREIRKQKNRSVLAASAGDDEMRREAQMKINQMTGKYKDLSDAFGLKTKAERMSVSGYHRVEERKALPAGLKKIEKGGVEKIRRPEDLNPIISEKATDAIIKRQKEAINNVAVFFSSDFEKQLIESALSDGEFSDYLKKVADYADKNLKSAARKYIKNVNEHMNAIENPEVHDKMYYTNDERRCLGAFSN